jgi:hypothetical protein
MSWGSRGRRFKSGRPDQKVQVRRGSELALGPLSDLREPIGESLDAGQSVCDPGRCLTPEFRFLGDRLRTRFRYLHDTPVLLAGSVLPGRLSCQHPGVER